MNFSIKTLVLALAIMGGTSIVTACTGRELAAAGAGAAGGYIIGKETD